MYYDLFQQVRERGAFETWLEFFLEGVSHSAKQALRTAEEINQLFKDDLKKIESLGRARFSCVKTLDYLKQLPQVSVSLLSQKLSISLPTARSSLNHMIKLGILEEVTGKGKDKVYVYRKYLSILEKGAEPL